MTTKEALIQLFNESFSSEEEIVKSIRANSGDPRPVYSLKGINERRAWYYLFVENDLEKAKQCFFLYGKIQEYLCESTTVNLGPGMAQDGTYTLLSDHAELISSFTRWSYNGYNQLIKKGETKRIIQLIAAKRDQEAYALLDTFYSKHRKYAFKEVDGGILKGILDKDKNKVEEFLEILLLPKNHKKRNGIYPLRRDILSIPALGFAKLAWSRGVEVDIDHPLIPKALLPIKPNATYENTYDFLK